MSRPDLSSSFIFISHRFSPMFLVTPPSATSYSAPTLLECRISAARQTFGGITVSDAPESTMRVIRSHPLSLMPLRCGLRSRNTLADPTCPGARKDAPARPLGDSTSGPKRNWRVGTTGSCRLTSGGCAHGARSRFRTYDVQSWKTMASRSTTLSDTSNFHNWPPLW